MENFNSQKSYQFEYEWEGLLEKYHIKYNINSNGSVNILDSYEIKNDLVKSKFINFLIDTGIDFGKRNEKSLIKEWKAHNICYKKGWFKKHTADTGLDPNEKWTRKVFYTMICFFFKEK